MQITIMQIHTVQYVKIKGTTIKTVQDTTLTIIEILIKINRPLM